MNPGAFRLGTSLTTPSRMPKPSPTDHVPVLWPPMTGSGTQKLIKRKVLERSFSVDSCHAGNRVHPRAESGAGKPFSSVNLCVVAAAPSKVIKATGLATVQAHKTAHTVTRNMCGWCGWIVSRIDS